MRVLHDPLFLAVGFAAICLLGWAASRVARYFVWGVIALVIFVCIGSFYSPPFRHQTLATFGLMKTGVQGAALLYEEKADAKLQSLESATGTGSPSPGGSTAAPVSAPTTPTPAASTSPKASPSLAAPTP